MENLEQTQFSEFEKQPNLDEIARNYAETIRDYLQTKKEKEADIHFKDINPKELTFDDLMIFDKYQKNTLTKMEFKSYRERLQDYFNGQKKLKGKDFDYFKDSRSNFFALIQSQIIAKEDNRGHPENPLPTLE